MAAAPAVAPPEHRDGQAEAEDEWTRLERTRTRFNRRSLLFGFLGFLLYGAGANVGAGWVIVLAALLIGSLPFGWLTARRAAAAVDVRRVGPRLSATDTTTRVQVSVRAPTGAYAVVHDELSGSAGASRELRTGTTLEGEVWLPRGLVRDGLVTVVLNDLFGLVDATARGRVPTEIEVLPAVPAVRGTRPRVSWAVEAGQIAARQGGGSEVIGVREYQRGDPVRAVHWRSSARREQLVVREYAEEARPRLVVEVAGGTWERSCLDVAVEAASGVAQDARRNGFPTDVAVDGLAAAWSQGVRRHLALLPPHAGAEARPLAPPPHISAQVVVRFEPGTDGPRVVVSSRGGFAEFGVLPVDTPRDRIGDWLSDRLSTLS